MKKIKLTPDQYKNIDIRQMPPDSMIEVKLTKGNKVFEKVVEKKDGTGSFTFYSVGVMHNGNDCYLKITPAVAKKWAEFKMGDTVTIMALPSQLKGGKSYVASKEEEDESSPSLSELSSAEKIIFEKIISQMIDLNLSLTNIDDVMIRDTLFADFKYSPEDAEALVPAFKKYCKDKM